ncbi:MAG TPA: GspH/FimT family protein [Burkholderiaceae bacterium]|nr:GspH/FimT family protein [Burkholderiaceae bacterium]
MPRPPSRRLASSGFTLTEVLIALGIGAALTAAAAPALVDMAAQREQMESSDRLATSLRVARSQAVFGSARVTICPADYGQSPPRCASAGGDWSGGWLAYADVADEGAASTFDPEHGDRLLFAQPALESGVALVAFGEEVSAIRFESDGTVRRNEAPFGTTTWKLTSTGSVQRWVCLNALGRVSVASGGAC